MAKNTGKIIGIVAVVVVLLILIFAFGTQQTLLTGSNRIELPNQEKNIIWEEMDVLLNAPWFGSLKSGTRLAINNNNPVKICDDNDGEIFISNSFSVEKNLIINSAMSGAEGKFKSSCINSITAEIEAIPGKYLISCDSLVTHGQSQATSSCIVNGETISSASTLAKEIILNESDKLIVVAESFGMNGASASTKAIIRYEPFEIKLECPDLNILDCQSSGLEEVIEIDSEGCQINFCSGVIDIPADVIDQENGEVLQPKINYIIITIIVIIIILLIILLIWMANRKK